LNALLAGDEGLHVYGINSQRDSDEGLNLNLNFNFNFNFNFN